MNDDILLCFACAIVVGEEHPIASTSMSLLRGFCAICGRDTWCDRYSAKDVYKGKYERRKNDG